MSRFITLALVMGAVAVPSTAIGSTPRCTSATCTARVAKKREIHRSHPMCNTWSCTRRVNRKRARRVYGAKLAFIKPYINGFLLPTGTCESSRGTWSLKAGLGAVSPGGRYRGRYQFGWDDWAKARGPLSTPVVDPVNADWLEQAYRAVIWLLRNGRQSWPNC